MNKLVLTGLYLDVAPLRWELMQNEGLWNEHTGRTEGNSPHRELDDIWVRYAEGGVRTNEPHEPVWYKAADYLPVKAYVDEIARLTGATKVGGVLITRIHPGGTCHPHVDHGWHARHYEKFALQVASAPGQFFHVEDEKIEPKPGEIFWFDNSFNHWVTNETPYERITLIVSLKKEEIMNNLTTRATGEIQSVN